MTNYEQLRQLVNDYGIRLEENLYLGNDHVPPENYLLGISKPGRIGLARELQTDAEKIGILAEEFGHNLYTVGNIIDQTDIRNRKMELEARNFAYDLLVGIDGIADCIRNGCQSCYEAAEFLGISESFLRDAIKYYHGKYGCRIETDTFDLYFEPTLLLVEKP